MGGADGDILRGGGGADQLAGGAGSDVASYFDSATGVTINLETGVNTGGTAAGDTIANDVETINGSNHDDVMTGNALGNGLDRVRRGTTSSAGGGNNDTLRGGSGADVLNGGAGADYFSYTAVSDSTALATDTIQDFQARADLISVRLIDADGNSGNGDTAFSFIGTGAFTSTAGQLRYDSGGGTTTVSADVDGNSTADIVIDLDRSVRAAGLELPAVAPGRPIQTRRPGARAGGRTTPPSALWRRRLHLFRRNKKRRESSHNALIIFLVKFIRYLLSRPRQFPCVLSTPPKHSRFT